MNMIKNGVISCLAESLALDESEIDLKSSLTKDLGADSLDFLDITFGLEKKFQIKLRDSALDKLLKMEFTTEGDNFLSDSEIISLEPWMPALKERSEAKVSVYKLFSFITVESLVLLVESKMVNK
jgi:acyl carrier protein